MARKKPEVVAEVVEDDYHDQESEWEDMMTVNKESESKQLFESFTGGTEKGIAGKTHLTPKQAVALTHLRTMQKSFERRGMLWMAEEIGTMIEWFETYRLSVNRKSRVEAVEVWRGKMNPTSVPQPQPDPTRFN